MQLAFRTSIDVFVVAQGFASAGFEEVRNSVTGYPSGAEGYFALSGAAYLTSFDSIMVGNGVLPVLLHQDPRYFRLGYGSALHRILYAASAALVCKHDNQLRWEPNYSNIGGDLAAGGISTFYYPEKTGLHNAFSSGVTQLVIGAVATEFQEFGPDVMRIFQHKDPTHGRDAEKRAKYLRDKAEHKRVPFFPQPEPPEPPPGAGSGQ